MIKYLKRANKIKIKKYEKELKIGKD